MFFLQNAAQAWSAELCDPPQITENGIDTSKWPQKNLIVAISSDRGLCGGKSKSVRPVNTEFSRQMAYCLEGLAGVTVTVESRVCVDFIDNAVILDVVVLRYC